MRRNKQRKKQREPFCHPEDPSIARGGRISDSFAAAKPVPVSTSRSAPYVRRNRQSRHTWSSTLTLLPFWRRESERCAAFSTFPRSRTPAMLNFTHNAASGFLYCRIWKNFVSARRQLV